MEQNNMTTVQQSDHAYRVGRCVFVAAFIQRLAELGRPTTTTQRGTVAFWLDRGGHLGWATVTVYTGPDIWRPSCPLITRIKVNDTWEWLPARVLRGFGLEPRGSSTCGWEHLSGIEVTTLPEELAALAPWVADWVVNRAALGYLLPPPPVPICATGGQVDPRSTYEWTAAAHVLHDAWAAKERERRRLLETRLREREVRAAASS
jgi:hypothetical protein